MNGPSRALCALLLASLAPAPLRAGPRSSSGLPRVQRELLLRLGDGGPRGVVELGLAPDAYAELARLHARGTAFELARFPLSGGRETVATLRPVSAFEPGARAQVVAADGSVAWLEARVRCFAGALAGGGELFLGITPEGLEGYFRADGALHFLSSAGAPDGRVFLAHAEALAGAAPAADFCALRGVAPLRTTPEEEHERLVTPRLRTANIFIEADPVYRQLFPSNQACIDYSTLLLSAASEVYWRDVGVRLALPNGYLRVWNTSPPWGTITTFGDITRVRNYWTSLANPDRSLPRAAVHVLTAPVFGGVAYTIGGVCDPSQGYEISSVYGHFPTPLQHLHNDNWDLFVVTHEFGHSFGSVHSFDYQPPIQCTDGSGPDQGTIMSYCHLTFGVGGVGMRFHVREQRAIREYVDTAGCFQGGQPLGLGDYDADGAVDADDLAAASAILVQGFRSLGAEAVLDLDCDGDFDAADRDRLAAQLGAPPARAIPRNGSGRNTECLYVLANPVLGRTWSPIVVATPAGRLTGLFFHDLPHPGLATPYGELLVLPPSLGGRQLFTHTAASTGILAVHDLALPFDLALVGLTATVQGVVIGAPGTELCNALDLVFSPYE